MFYDVFVLLCERKGISPNKALTDCKISRTSTAKWREGATPRGVTLQKIADYFNVTTDYLLTGDETKKAPIQSSGEHMSDKEIKAAFFRGADPTVTKEEMDAMWEDAKEYFRFKLEQRRRKQGDGK